MSDKLSIPICKGSWRLGTACGACERCRATTVEAAAVIRELLRDRNNPWTPIISAPKSNSIDLLGKVWRSDTDDFTYRRFPDCSWDDGDPMGNRKAGWRGLDDGYRAVAWMPRPREAWTE